MDPRSVEDVVYVQHCTVLSVLLAVCCSVERANLRKHGRAQTPRGESTTSPIILISQSLRGRAAGMKQLAATCVFGYRSVLNYICSVYLSTRRYVYTQL